jgi:hypothetical protein
MARAITANLLIFAIVLGNGTVRRVFSKSLVYMNCRQVQPENYFFAEYF